MPLENATYINDLVSTNPVATDQMGQGYQHLTLIKAVLKAQFPNWTSAVLNSTQAKIDAVASAFNGPGGLLTVPAGTASGGQVNLLGFSSGNTLSVANGSGSFNYFTTVQGSTTSTLLGSLDASGNLTVKGAANAPNGFFTGAANTTVVSWVGEIRIHGGTLATIPVGWHLCDGTSGTPDLRDKFVAGAGNTYAVGTQGGQNTHVLTAAEMPVHNHAAVDAGHGHTIFDPGHNHNVNEPGHAHTVGAAISATGNFSGGGSAPFPTGGQVATSTVGTGIFLSAAATGIGVAAGFAQINIGNAGSGAAHENRPPFYALCYVMRIV